MNEDNLDELEVFESVDYTSNFKNIEEKLETIDIKLEDNYNFQVEKNETQIVFFGFLIAFFSMIYFFKLVFRNV